MHEAKCVNSNACTLQAARHRAEKIPFIVMRGFGISSIAYFLDALVAGGLVWMAAVSFKQANEAPPEQQLPHVFQGLMQVGLLGGLNRDRE